MSDSQDTSNEIAIIISAGHETKKEIKQNITNNKLNELNNCIKAEPFILDELLNSEVHHGSTFLNIINFIIRSISIFRLEMNVGNKNDQYDRYNAIKKNIIFSEHPNVKYKRIIFFAILLSLSIPYAYYVYLVPNLSDSGVTNIYFEIFMTILNITSLTCWIVFVMVPIRKKNTVSKIQIKLLRLSFNDKQEELITSQNTVSTIDPNYDSRLNTKEYETLLELVEEVRSLSNLGEQKIKKRNIANRAQWELYMVVVLIWTVLLFIIYGVWISVYVFETTCNSKYGGVCFTFLILLFTSVLRFSVPLFILFYFVYECDIIKQKANDFIQLHYGKVNVSNLSILLRNNMICFLGT